MPHLPVRRVAAAAIACVALSSPLPAQDKDTLWTKVAAQNKTVTLSWDKDHPWDMTLTAQGPELMARYFVDGRREVSESLGRGNKDKNERRTLRFSLPDSMRGSVSGAVCLFFQMPDRRGLPIRRANAQDADTVGFRYEPWDRQMHRAAEITAARERVATAERTLASATQRIDVKAATMKQRGWTDQASCEQVNAPTFVPGPRPYDVVNPAEQDDVARHVCVNRVVMGYVLVDGYIEDRLPKRLPSDPAARDVEAARKALSAAFDPAFAGPKGMTPAALIDAIVERLGRDNATVKARQPQIAEFARDWSKFIPGIKDYVPHLGEPDEYLNWPSTAQQSAFRIFGPDLAKQVHAEWAMQGVPAPTVRDLESFLGSSLDAYAGCVEDSTKQLRTKYEAWDALRSNAPQRAAAARDFLIRECRQEMSALDKMKADLSSLQEQFARDKQALNTAETPIALASSPVVLNTVSCGRPAQ